MKKQTFLGVIPARGGSKRVPRKNIKLIAGKPLIAWTIEAAFKSKLMDRFVVSTEDPEIADISRKYGAEVIPRPRELAVDSATSLSVLQHVLSHIPADAIVLLQPTSPFRGPTLIDSCIREFGATGADNLATGFICKFMEYGARHNKPKDLQGFFYDDGNVYVVRSELIKKGKWCGKKVQRVFTSREENVEIDDGFDFWLAEQILRRKTKIGR